MLTNPFLSDQRQICVLKKHYWIIRVCLMCQLILTCEKLNFGVWSLLVLSSNVWIAMNNCLYVCLDYFANIA